MTVSPLSTGLFYSRAASSLASLTAQSDTLGTQISTGKKLQSASDDVVAYQRLRTIATATADGTADAANVTTAQALLSSADTTLTSIGTQLQQASTLALQARNGTLSDSDRDTIAQQLGDIADTLVSLANTKDSRGQALFGGTGAGDAVTTNADGTHTLAASTPATIPIGGGQSVQAGANATQVLGTAEGGNIVDKLKALAAALTTGGDTTDALGTAITDLGTATTQASDVQASLGARGARLDLVSTQLTDAATTRESERAGLEDTDVTAAITQLQKTMTVLQATQASFTKLSSLSLFDYLK